VHEDYDEISHCRVGLCAPLHVGYQDSILENNILGHYLRGQHLRTSSYTSILAYADFLDNKYVT
jgi:hypothetical protein